jgi:nucleoside phosphorylase
MATLAPNSIKNEPLRWLIVAAMSREIHPLRRLALPHLLLMKTGIGMRNVEQTFHHNFTPERVRAVVNIGLAGALSPILECGDLVIAQEVQASVSTCPTPNLCEAAGRIRLKGLKICRGTIITLDKMLCHAVDKQRLAQQLSPGTIACVDMESAAIAKVCGKLQIPFLIIRSISDCWDEDLPLDFNRCRKKDGNLDMLKILALAVRHPRSFRGLLELRRRSCHCAGHLALFVEQLVGMAIDNM